MRRNYFRFLNCSCNRILISNNKSGVLDRSYSTEKEVVITPKEVQNFCYRCMVAVKTKEAHATALADVLMAADYAGHFSHGLNRISMYVKDIEAGTTKSNCEPKIIQEKSSVALVDGMNCLGPVVGNFGMQIAIDKARNTGVGWVAANHSNHYGIAGWYSQLACDAGLLGMSFTNTSPLAFPTRANEVGLGTNPLTLAAPGARKEDNFMLDMATTAVALGKIEMKRRQKEPLPVGWAADKSGKVTTDANDGYNGGLLPIGGQELTGGYKGYGLSMLVEIFCGIMADSLYATSIRKWGAVGNVANLGQGFVAIDPSAFAPGFKDRMSDLASCMRKLSRTDNDLPVLIPGDKERAHKEFCDNNGGIPYPKVLIDNMDALAVKLKIEKMKTN